MPAKCYYCETNTHPTDDEGPCIRDFVTPKEALAIIEGMKLKKDEYHVYSNPKENMLIGIDFPRNQIVDLLEDSKHIEICDPQGHARKIKHGLCITRKSNEKLFIETDEEALKCYEELYCK